MKVVLLKNTVNLLCYEKSMGFHIPRNVILFLTFWFNSVFQLVKFLGSCGENYCKRKCYPYNLNFLQQNQLHM